MDKKIISDEKLCKEAALGDKRSAEELIKRYKRMVTVSARPYYLAGADSEDLIQEGMLGLMKAIREYDAGEKVPFCVFAELCVKNNIYTAIRNATRKKHRPLNEYISLGEPLFEDTVSVAVSDIKVSDPEDALMDKETRSELKQALSGMLSSFEKQVMDRYLEGRSYDEIASDLGKTKKSVDNAVTRTSRKLSDYYRSLGDSR